MIQGKPAKYSGGWAVPTKNAPLQPAGYELGPLQSNEVDIKVTHNGVCHSDLHMRDDDWFISKFPFVPGHEVVGEVIATGASVANLKIGQRVGAGWMRDSCRRCAACVRGEENICEPGYTGTIVMGNNGGFQAVLRLPADFAFSIPDALESIYAAPLLCAGVTVYAPLKKWMTRPGMKVAVIGIGGLGHLGLQFASKMGGIVWGMDRTGDKEPEAKSFGADHYMVMSPEAVASLKGKFDVILNCASGAVTTASLMSMLCNDGVLVQIGIPGDNAQMTVPLTDLVFGQKKVVGSIVGGRSDMISMMNLAAAKGIKPLVQVMPSHKVNEAMDMVKTGKARYRIVLDMISEPDAALVIKT